MYCSKIGAYPLNSGCVNEFIKCFNSNIVPLADTSRVIKPVALFVSLFIILKDSKQGILAMQEFRNTRTKLSCMPTVKAYELSDRIVLKYYDDGQASSLQCPHCLWSGEIAESPAFAEASYSEMKCPECKARLGTITHTKDTTH